MTQQTETAETATNDTSLAFEVLNEIGIINQLATTMLARCLPEGVHPSHFGIVNHLVRTGDRKTPLRIARAMQVTKNTMTHSLKVLEGHGFIHVTPNPDDARGKLVFLTEAGRRFRKDAVERVLDMLKGNLEDPQFQAMARVRDDLIALRKHFDANRLPLRSND